MKTDCGNTARRWLLSLLFIERQNSLTVELDAVRKKRNQLLDNNGFEREIAQTEILIELIQSSPYILEEYDEDLFLQLIDQVIINENHAITFRLKNSLELTEYCRGRGVTNDAKSYNGRLYND